VLEIKGRDLMNGVPKELVISERQIAESLAEPVGAIIEAVKSPSSIRRRSSPPISSDKGNRADGGGALSNLDFVCAMRPASGLLARDP